MPTFTIDTNAGPILTRTFDSPASVRTFVEASIPLLRRKGYTSTWRRSGAWHVIDVANTRGRVVHSAAFKLGTMSEREDSCGEDTWADEVDADTCPVHGRQIVLGHYASKGSDPWDVSQLACGHDVIAFDAEEPGTIVKTRTPRTYLD